MIRVLTKRIIPAGGSSNQLVQVHECTTVAGAEKWITENPRYEECWIVRDMYKFITVKSLEFEKVE